MQMPALLISKDFLKTYLPQDLLVPWEANFARLEDEKIIPEELEEVRYVPRLSLSSLCKFLAANLLVKTQIKIANLKQDNHWSLEDSNGLSTGQKL